MNTRGKISNSVNSVNSVVIYYFISPIAGGVTRPLYLLKKFPSFGGVPKAGWLTLPLICHSYSRSRYAKRLLAVGTLRGISTINIIIFIHNHIFSHPCDRFEHYGKRISINNLLKQIRKEKYHGNTKI